MRSGWNRRAPFLGSASTHLLSGLGGFDGRPLRKGDVLRIGSGNQWPFRKRTIAPASVEGFEPRKVLRVTPGPQFDWFPESCSICSTPVPIMFGTIESDGASSGRLACSPLVPTDR